VIRDEAFTNLTLRLLFLFFNYMAQPIKQNRLLIILNPKAKSGRGTKPRPDPHINLINY